MVNILRSASISAGIPVGMNPALLANPFYTLSKGIKRPQSIAFAVVYAVFLILYVLRRCVRRGHKMAYLFLLVFCLLRVPAFAVRYAVASASPDASNFMELLIVNGVLTVGGFLFLAEAFLVLFFQYLCCLRGVSGAGHKGAAITHHAIVVVISMIGVVGAVLQITALNALNMKQFSAARAVRQTSGVLFCAVGLYPVVATLLLLLPRVRGRLRPGNRNRIPQALSTAIFVLSGGCVTVESVYRVWSASATVGWIVSEEAIDTLLVLPELVILTLFLVFDMEDFEHVTILDPRKRPLPRMERRAQDHEEAEGEKGCDDCDRHILTNSTCPKARAKELDV